MNLKELRETLTKKQGERLALEAERKTVFHSLRVSKRELLQYEQAREIIREVARLTQDQLEYKISELSSLALASIFPDPYKLTVEFVPRRNKTEADIMLESGDMKLSPLTVGGGVVDIVSLGLRLSLWSVRRPRLRNVIILDEPFRFLHSRDLQDRAGLLLKELSKELNIQFIIINPEDEMPNHSDRVFLLTKTKGVSSVEVDPVLEPGWFKKHNKKAGGSVHG